jgi:glycine cleavage system H protein
MNIPENYLYTKDHEWLEILDGNQARVGITEFAQQELGDVVYVDLPKLDQTSQQGGAFAVVESVKAASDVYAPVSCKVLKKNDLLTTKPELVNQDCYGEGFFAVIEMTNESEKAQLLTAKQYQEILP